MNRVFIFCPKCQDYSWLKEMSMGFNIEYFTLCCYKMLRNQHGQVVKNQAGLIQLLQERCWKVGGKQYQTTT
jgi:hypothetical protein